MITDMTMTTTPYNDVVKYSAIAWANTNKDGVKTVRNLTMTANVVPTDAQHPFMVLNQNRSKVKLRINNNTKEGGSKILDYNIEIPELCLLLKQAEHCSIIPTGQLNKIPGNGEKMVSEPDENGFAMVKKLTMKHNANLDGNNEFPWYIAIEHGKALSVMQDNGTRYAQPGTYKMEERVYINLSEEDMYSLCYWTNLCIERFLEGTRKTILKSWMDMQNTVSAVASVS